MNIVPDPCAGNGESGKSSSKLALYLAILLTLNSSKYMGFAILPLEYEPT